MLNSFVLLVTGLHVFVAHQIELVEGFFFLSLSGILRETFHFLDTNNCVICYMLKWLQGNC